MPAGVRSIQLNSRWAAAAVVVAVTVLAAFPRPAAADTVTIEPALSCQIFKLYDGSTGGDCDTPLLIGESYGCSYTPSNPPESCEAYRALVRFDVASVLPPGAVIEHAEIDTDSWSPNGPHVYELTAPWTDDVDWNTRDGVNLWSSGCCVVPRGASYDRVERNPYDLADVVSAWASGAGPNNGMLFTAPWTFASSDNFEVHPQLTITYEPDLVAPDVYLDGVLYEDRATELVPDLYDLAIDAQDDNTRVTEVRVLVDGAVAHVAGPDDPCDGSACDDVDTDFDLDADGFTGTHSFEVRATDAAGNVRSIAWTASFNGTPFPIDDLLDDGFDGRSDALPTASGDGAGCAFLKEPDAGVLTDARPTAIVHGRWKGDRGAGPETTEYFGDRQYRVTRCHADGTLLISQLVGPVRVPGGIALLELGRTVPEGDDFGTSTLDYASPSDPVFARAWARGRVRALANTIPPTKP